MAFRFAHRSAQEPVLGDHGPWLALITGGRRGSQEFVPLAQKIAAFGIRVLLHDRRSIGASDDAVRALFLMRLTGGAFAAGRLPEMYYGQFIHAARREPRAPHAPSWC
jgi:hypothetical protein